jgi:hypothetical protein
VELDLVGTLAQLVADLLGYAGEAPVPELPVGPSSGSTA